jgi:hypothetical protein
MGFPKHNNDTPGGTTSSWVLWNATEYNDGAPGGTTSSWTPPKYKARRSLSKMKDSISRGSAEVIDGLTPLLPLCLLRLGLPSADSPAPEALAQELGTYGGQDFWGLFPKGKSAAKNGQRSTEVTRGNHHADSWCASAPPPSKAMESDLTEAGSHDSPPSAVFESLTSTTTLNGT